MVDPHAFDGLVRRLSGALSRRTLVGGSLGAAMLAAVGLSDAALAKGHRKRSAGKRARSEGGHQSVHAEACVPSGKQCPAKRQRGKNAKKLGCEKCCQGAFETFTNSKGKQVKKCTCKAAGSSCSSADGGGFQCCSGVCENGACVQTACTNNLNFCNTNADCCSRFCADFVCEPAGSCQVLNSTCTADGQCCSGFCGDGTCLQAGSCVALAGACTGDAECCSGFCGADTCQTPGSCTDTGDACT